MTANYFKELYESEKYDIIWIGGHAEFHYNNPHDSFLLLDENTKVYLHEIIDFNIPPKKQRLLFLNVCNGGSTAVLDGKYSLGFASLLSNKNQAVISHLWPINPFVSMIFAFLYAINLIEYKEYFISFMKASKNLQSGKDKILELLESNEIAIEIINRIKNNESIDWPNLANWGSSVYYN